MTRLPRLSTEVIMEGNLIKGIIAESKSGRNAILAKRVVDCTGDADVCYRAGAPFERAGDIDPAQTLTTPFRMVNVDVKRAKDFGKNAMWAKMEEAASSGNYNLPRREGSWHITTQQGVIHTIMTRVADVDGTDPVALTQAEIEGRKQALEYARFLCDFVTG